MSSLFLWGDFCNQEMHVHPKAQPSVKGSVGSPMPGEVIDVRVQVGDKVEKGAPVVILSAMKMEMVVSAPISGTVKNLHARKGLSVEGEDLLVEIE